MNVVVAASSFPRRPDDHAGRFVLDLSRALAALGHRLHHVVPLEDGAAAFEELGEGLSVDRVRCAPNWIGSGLAYGDGMGENLKRAPWKVVLVPSLVRALRSGVRDAVRRRGAGAVLSHWLFPGAYAAAAPATEAGVPHLICEHGGGLSVFERLPGGRRLLTGLLARAAHTVFVSEGLRARAAALASRPHRCSVQAMGVDAARFSAPDSRVNRESLGARAGDLLIAGAGRLVALKGFDLLIDALAGVPDAVLVLAGDGPLRSTLERRARQAGVRASFTGHAGSALLAALYRTADVVAVPSRVGPRGRTEGAPMVIAEAFHFGKPVVASAAGGALDVIRDGGNGWLFAPGDTRALNAVLLRLAADRDLLAATGAGAAAMRERVAVEATARHFDAVLRNFRS